jgi:hypothetical protein
MLTRAYEPPSPSKGNLDRGREARIPRERPRAPSAQSSSELAECNCPEFCERDHANE